MIDTFGHWFGNADDNDVDPRARTTLRDGYERRRYLRIQPAEGTLDPGTVAAQFRQFHSLKPADTRSRLQHLYQARPTATIEWLVFSHGRPNRLEYYVGVDPPGNSNVLERVCRGLFPDTYQFEHVELHPADFANAGPTPDDDLPDPWVAGVEFWGSAAGRRDWRTCLRSFGAIREGTDGHRIERQARADGRGASTASTGTVQRKGTAAGTSGARGRVPLASVIETMVNTPVPIVYQVLMRPYPSFSHGADSYQQRIYARYEDDDRDTQPTKAELTPSDAQRVEELTAKDARRSFAVNARAVALTGAATTTAINAAADLASTLDYLSHTSYSVFGRLHHDDELRELHEPPRGQQVLTDLETRTFYPPNYERFRTRLPFSYPRSRGVVADPSEAPSFCLLDSTVTAGGERGLAATASERAHRPRPPEAQLETYRTTGLTLGHPVTENGQTEPKPIAVPPTLQPLHAAWLGKTGSGKSTALVRAILDNHAATDGADILIAPKGDGLAEQYCRAHYARYGDLNDVIHFDCSEVLPAFSFFDIRAELQAGVGRTTAVEDVADHYLDILMGIMGRERFEQAVRSPDVIRYLVKALFDPVHGDDAYTHRALHQAARRMHERQTAPAVSDSDLERMLAGVTANRTQSFDEIMQGVANRIEKIPADERLGRVFNHVSDIPSTTHDSSTLPDTADDGPRFDLADHLDEDTVIIFDTGGLRSEAQRVLALVVLSNLWTALRRRKQAVAAIGTKRAGDDLTDTDDDPDRDTELAPADPADPLVNLYVEEAASIAISDLLQTLLAQARGFDCAITLAMQFPAQLRERSPSAYEEVLNNVSTLVTGNVPHDRPLAERLATDELNADAVGARLRALTRGEWLAALPAGFGDTEPRPFRLESGALPDGHPDGDDPLDDTGQVRFDAARTLATERTREAYGLTLTDPGTVEPESEVAEPDAASRVDSALPHTQRLPPMVTYDAASHALQCADCDNRYDPSIDGLRRAISCCSSLAEADRADIPICEVNLKLTADERAATEWSDTQLLFLQAVYNAQQLRYDPLEYDLLYDSMLRLEEYVGIDSEAVQDLLDTDVLRHDTDHPHRLFSVTPAGREVIGESYRQGVDYGHGQGDLEESSQHVLGVEVGRRWLEQEFVDNPDSPATEVVPYYDLPDSEHRLDIAALDTDGDVIVPVEVERVNNDLRKATPADFDKMAACDPEAAIWIVMSQRDGHAVLDALCDPADGDPRVEASYAETTPPQQFTIDTAGLTAMYPVRWLRDRLD
ncbi:hypothetical protein ACFPYI_08585 [Halomarina salina]|uniref:ATP-binding protein n=1 Tax=Halomarina salina TaxID=1872699 RepID=A0ABD5RLB1_9EURY|nr:hypothetical protein [Halomarina salina]